MILQCIFVQHQRKTSIFKILLAPDHPPPFQQICGAARLSDRLWFGKPPRQVLVQHSSPSGCGSTSLPGRFWSSTPPRQTVVQQASPAGCVIAFLLAGCGVAWLPSRFWLDRQNTVKLAVLTHKFLIISLDLSMPECLFKFRFVEETV